MRRQDKRKNIEQANLMLENSYLKSKGLLKENLKLSNGETVPEDITKISKMELAGYFGHVFAFRSSLGEEFTDLFIKLKNSNNGSEIWKKYVGKLAYYQNRLYAAVDHVLKNKNKYGGGNNKTLPFDPFSVAKKIDPNYIDKSLDGFEAIITNMENELKKHEKTRQT